jgi:hypothetical protein
MGKKLFHDPQHWLDRAEGARKLAAEILDPVSKRMILDIAESYESSAGRAEIAGHSKFKMRHDPEIGRLIHGSNCATLPC